MKKLYYVGKYQLLIERRQVMFIGIIFFIFGCLLALQSLKNIRKPDDVWRYQMMRLWSHIAAGDKICFALSLVVVLVSLALTIWGAIAGF